MALKSLESGNKLLFVNQHNRSSLKHPLGTQQQTGASVGELVATDRRGDSGDVLEC